MDAKYLLIVTAKNGLVARDTPRPQSEGGIQVGAPYPVGSQIFAYDIHNINGVPYARIVPRNPYKNEWVRTSETGGANPYADVVPLEDDSQNELAKAINNLAEAIRSK